MHPIFKKYRHFFLIFGFFLFHVILNILILYFDQTPPRIDASGHIMRSYEFFRIINNQGFIAFFGTLFSFPTYPPLFYVSSLPFCFFGDVDVMVYVNFLYLLILLFFGYFYLSEVSSSEEKYWFVALIMFIPIVFGLSRVFLLDFAVFCLLPVSLYFYEKSRHLTVWQYSLLFVLVFSLSFLVKWFAWMFLFPYFFIRFFSFDYKKFNYKLFFIRLARYVFYFILASLLPLLWFFVNNGQVFRAASHDINFDFMFSSSVFWMSAGPLLFIFLVLFLVFIGMFFLKKSVYRKLNLNLYFSWLFSIFSVLFFVSFVARQIPRWYMGIYLFMLFFCISFLLFLQHKLFDKKKYFKHIFMIFLFIIMFVFFIIFHFITIDDYGETTENYVGKLSYNSNTWYIQQMTRFIIQECNRDKLSLFLTDSFAYQDNFNLYLLLSGKSVDQFVYSSSVINWNYVYNETDILNKLNDADVILDVINGDRYKDLPYYNEYTNLTQAFVANLSPEEYDYKGNYTLPSGVSIDLYIKKFVH